MSSAARDKIAGTRSYGGLLSKFPPRIIHSPAERKRVYDVIEKLMAVEKPSKDQLEFLELLSTIAEQHESEKDPTPTTSVASLLEHLIDAKGVKQSEVAKATGISRSTISDVIAGRRTLSVANIKLLAGYFCVDSSLFV